MIFRRKRAKFVNTGQTGGVNIQAERIDTVNVLPPAAEPARMLPADVPGFTGRAAEVARLLATADNAGSVVVSAIDGTPGVGKTALVLRVAHLARDRFPDGQLYADLRGHTEGLDPADPADVLAGFLRALGVAAEDIPAGLDERAARYRSAIGDRAMLVVLDNAAREAQVRPLLPGAPGCFVLITSRHALGGLDVTDRLLLPIMPAAEAYALLAGVLGEARTHAEPEAAEEIVDLCAGLPLALRIVAARLESAPALTLTAMATALADETRRLSELEVGDRAVRAAFALSYRALPADQARMFRRLAAHPGTDFAPAAAAALADVPDPAATLSALVTARLVEHHIADHHRLHDLVRLFARERLAPDERANAQSRVLEHYLSVAVTAAAMLEERGTVDGQSLKGKAATAVVYLDHERPNLVASVALAAATGRADLVPGLALALSGYLERRRHLDDLVTVQEQALAAVAGNPRAEADVRVWLTHTYEMLGRTADAQACAEQGIALSERLGDLAREGNTVSNLALAKQEAGQLAEAVALFERALDLLRKAGDTLAIGRTLNNLGTSLRGLGRVADAADRHRQAVQTLRECDAGLDSARAMSNLGGDLLHLGDHAIAAHLLAEALGELRRHGDRHCEAVTLFTLAQAEILGGGIGSAREHAKLAAAIFDDLGDIPRKNIVRQLFVGL